MQSVVSTNKYLPSVVKSHEVIVKYPDPDAVGKSICTVEPFLTNGVLLVPTLYEKSSIAND